MRNPGLNKSERFLLQAQLNSSLDSHSLIFTRLIYCLFASSSSNFHNLFLDLNSYDSSLQFNQLHVGRPRF